MPYEKALPEDTRYRDLCVSGGRLGQGDFDNKSGAVKAPDIEVLDGYNYPDAYEDDPYFESDSQFIEKYTGNVIGSKPPLDSCMPMRDTSITPVKEHETDANRAFATYLNPNNRPFLSEKKEGYETAFFIGGALGCPDIIKLLPPSDPAAELTDHQMIRTYADLNRFRAKNCYNYYILNRSLKPWFALERPSRSGTDDPLTMFDSNRSILNNCQPLMNGKDAQRIQKALWNSQNRDPEEPYTHPLTGDEIFASVLEKTKGFAPVYRYEKRPDMDEAEYLMGTYLGRAWDDNFVQAKVAADPDNRGRFELNLTALSQTNPNVPASSLLQNPFAPGTTGSKIGLPCVQDQASSTNTNPCTPVTSCEVKPVPDYLPYTSPGMQAEGPNYCPNVEKITEPSHPFSPRHDIVKTGKKTDRDYSNDTSSAYGPFPSCAGPALGYTDYNDPGKNAVVPNLREKFPAVQCAVVPVDILDFRREQFENCITQRINLNINHWTAAGRPGMMAVDQPIGSGGYRPPCATRFWENDTAECDAKMSIQQCCRIIVKDVVPANFLKLRTCEGMKQARRDDRQMQQKLLELGIVPPAGSPPTTGGGGGGGNGVQFELAPGDIPVDGEPTGTGPGPGPGAQPGTGTGTIGGIGGNIGGIGTSGSDDPLVGGGGIGGLMAPPQNSALQNPNPEPDEYLDPYITNIVDEDFGFGPSDYYNPEGYYRAFKSNLVLNSHVCDDNTQTEPQEYRFRHYFQQFQNPFSDMQDPRFSSGIEQYVGNIVGYHMPYMRWWDTGVSAGNLKRGGSFVNTLGGNDVIIGVGREERDKTTAKLTSMTATLHRTAPGAENGAPSEHIQTPMPSQMGRVGGWDELKAHEMWTIRRNNMFCVGRYEKLFKPGGAENFVLSKAGSNYTNMNSQQMPWPLGWRGYITDSHRDPVLNHAPQKWHMPYFPETPASFDPERGKDWAGNTLQRDGVTPVSSIIRSDMANNFRGLDNAMEGDIVSIVINDIQQLMYVTKLYWEVDPQRANATWDHTINKYVLPNGKKLTPIAVLVESWDQGKFPTSTGSSNDWGQPTERKIYKYRIPEANRSAVCNMKIRALTDPTPVGEETQITSQCRDKFRTGANGVLPDLSPQECMSLECQPSCIDPELNECVLPFGVMDWNGAFIYRPSYNVRGCAEGGGVISLMGMNVGNNYDLEKTYNWNDPQDLRLPTVRNLDRQVIYQAQTGQVGTDLWSWCVNSGYDPPRHFGRGYRGPMTGATTDLTLCGGPWKSCKTSVPQERKCFPAINGGNCDQ